MVRVATEVRCGWAYVRVGRVASPTQSRSLEYVATKYVATTEDVEGQTEWDPCRG